MEVFFEIPIAKSISNHNNWKKNGRKEFRIARAFFKVITSHLPGPSSLGRKIEPFGSPAEHERFKRLVSEREVLNEYKTIEHSLIESQSLTKLMEDISAGFGLKESINLSGKISSELSSSIKESFYQEFNITQTIKERKEITFEFKDRIRKGDKDRLCYAEVYQKCRADVYLLRIDHLEVTYEKTIFGLRKKITKQPFPKNVNSIENHPNICRLGLPLIELNYWELLPGSSVIVKDSAYVQEVENDSEVWVKPPRAELTHRPYWVPPKYPSLYQVSRIAFPTRYIDVKDAEFTREELIAHEYGEAEESAWWYLYGPGNKKQKKSK